jgi:hypothetical protein
MSYVVTILDRRTGQSADAPQKFEWRNDETSASEFWWSEGNMGCDCNRFLEFERASGRDPNPDDATCVYDDFPNGRRFLVTSIRTPDGEEVYSEGDI